MPNQHEDKFLHIIRSDEWFLRLLKLVQSLGLEHWAIAAGTGATPEVKPPRTRSAAAGGRLWGGG